MIVGRGWGQGPTHSQNLQSVFSHIPGLKVVSALHQTMLQTCYTVQFLTLTL